MASDRDISGHCAVLREFILKQAKAEAMPKEGRAALKSALFLGEQLLLDIHAIADRARES
jgi:hypothetical protein